MSRILVHVIPILEDNYGYLIEDTQEKTVLFLDPGEAAPLLKVVAERELRPVAIWNTHHHADHIDGNGDILKSFPGLPVVGSLGDKGRIPQLTRFVQAGDELEFGGDKVRVLAIPGHTLGHIAFYFPSGHLFSGDLMFGYSCGKVFEGSFEQMQQSMAQLLELPDSVKVYCGHEYTLGNRRFAQAVEPDNPDLAERVARETSAPTVPLSLGQEKRTNPFLRWQVAAVQQYTGKSQPAEVFAELRTRKDNFR